MTFLALALPFVPGLLWLWFFCTRDKVQPEPKKVVLLTFLLGGLAAAPAVIGELAVDAFVPLTREIQLAALFEGRVPVGTLAALCFLFVGLFAALGVTLFRFIRWGRAHLPPPAPPPPVLSPPA